MIMKVYRATGQGRYFKSKYLSHFPACVSVGHAIQHRTCVVLCSCYSRLYVYIEFYRTLNLPQHVGSVHVSPIALYFQTHAPWPIDDLGVAGRVDHCLINRSNCTTL